MDDNTARELVIQSATKSTRFNIWIWVVFTVTGLGTMFIGIFTANTEEEAITILKIGLSIGFAIILLFYIMNWFSCLSFLKETKDVQVEDGSLQRLITMNRVCCIIFMIPLIFFVSLLGFHRVKAYAQGKVQKGSLDQIIYYFLIERNGKGGK